MVKLQLLLFFVLLVNSNTLFSQEVDSITYWQDIQPIIYNKCVPCHNPSGTAPFSLLKESDVYKRAKFIAYVTRTKYMPPWKADPAYQTYMNERVLDAETIDIIQKWYITGLKKGVKPQSPTYLIEENKEEEEPDLILRMEKPFNIPNTNKEEFRFFNVPTNLPTDTFISKIKFIPNNKLQLHHSRVMADTTNLIRGIDGLSEQDPKVAEFQKNPLADEFMYGWVPGNEGIIFPEGSGKKIYANTDIILNIHYAPSSIEQEDQSAVALYFVKQPIKKEVKTLALNENYIVNQPFYIPANRISTFYMNYGPSTTDISLISIIPHMHYLGKKFKAYAVTPSKAIIPLIKIDDWDFNWQSTYQFKTLLKIPKGSHIIVEGVYDNTTDNPANINFPPKDVAYGWNSTDEMFNFIIYYLEE
ncbi:MAG: hypothetical protein OEW75_19215 [Cyclobacteriaceae bacterium]|nr:hypothetical protein [Cyclobacteriaceae bacterium]